MKKHKTKHKGKNNKMKAATLLAALTLLLCFAAACNDTQDDTVLDEPTPMPEPTAPETPAPAPDDEPGQSTGAITWGEHIMGNIRADQLGYRRIGVKQAVVTDEEAAIFALIRADTLEPAFTGELSAPVFSPNSDETVRIADFSEFEEPGEYYVATFDGRSHPFVIDDAPYGDLRLAVLEFFNYQKCGIDLDDAGVWSHPACHTEPALIFDTEDFKDVTGGWHDAGDYGRYVVPAAKSIADLLYAFEMGAVQDDNLLDVVWYKVEWMLKMQDDRTGGVYHKVTTRNFPALDLWPQNDTSEVISPISPTATGGFAASLALASRFYPEHADELLRAAEKAWQWCLDNPDAPNFRNPAGIVTGEYGDWNSKDELYWAAAELFIATGDEVYHDFLKDNTDLISSEFGWQSVGSYALTAYLFGAGDAADSALTMRMRNKLLSDCQSIMDRFNESPYGESMGTNFVWGSNMHVANNAVTLLLGAKISDNPGYVEAAAQHLNYLLGFNSLGKSFITGYGPTGARYPHHRLTVAAGETVPGMVVGGPENGLSDPALQRAFTNATPVAKRYIDDFDSYASNEVTIYWNSPVYWLMAMLGV